jgi:hypothetical protein
MRGEIVREFQQVFIISLINFFWINDGPRTSEIKMYQSSVTSWMILKIYFHLCTQYGNNLNAFKCYKKNVSKIILNVCKKESSN